VRRCGSREPWGSCSLPACHGAHAMRPFMAQRRGKGNHRAPRHRSAWAQPHFPQTEVGREDLAKPWSTPVTRAVAPRAFPQTPYEGSLQAIFDGFCRTDGDIVPRHGAWPHDRRAPGAAALRIGCAATKVGTVGDLGPRDHTRRAHCRNSTVTSAQRNIAAQPASTQEPAGRAPVSWDRCEPQVRGFSEGHEWRPRVERAARTSSELLERITKCSSRVRRPRLVCMTFRPRRSGIALACSRGPPGLAARRSAWSTPGVSRRRCMSRERPSRCRARCCAADRQSR
jgi:hypothetical protein